MNFLFIDNKVIALDKITYIMEIKRENPHHINDSIIKLSNVDISSLDTSYNIKEFLSTRIFFIDGTTLDINNINVSDLYTIINSKK